MTKLADRLAALEESLELVSGRVDPQVEAEARRVVTHATRRLEAGPQTVAALAGATGSGKSSLFNAVSETRLAEHSARRPTTSETLAVSFAATNTELLDLLGVARRHEAEPPTPDLSSLILLDLPDHDSTASAHRAEVDRMVGLVDQFVWVLDPQKYADAAIHQNYLRPLAGHRDVISVVLNQADLLTPAQLGQCLAHLRRLLAADGLPDVPVLATSAVTGQGVAELRARLGQIAEAKLAASSRLSADLRRIAGKLDNELGNAETAQLSKEARSRLTTALGSAAGAGLVVSAVEASVLHRGAKATGWPLVSWLGRLRPDPLRRLRLGRGASPAELEAEVNVRSSLPRRSATTEAQLTSALRLVERELSEGLPDAWRAAVRGAVSGRRDELSDALDSAVVATDLLVPRAPWWWGVVRALQWALIAAVVVGFAWLTLNALLSFAGLPLLSTVPVGAAGGFRLPLPTLLVIGGVAAGLLLSGGSRLALGRAARRSGRRAAKAIDVSVARVAEELVLGPGQAEVDRYAKARSRLNLALG